MPMFIYHLARQETIAREENAALVVIAASETAARRRAAKFCGPEGEDAWLTRAHVDQLGIATYPWTAHSLDFACIDCLEA
jgi:hypothetical protein